ncbi:CMRF35-like molecule 8 isoform X2 [Parus major]|uniref:CMRF35-like molecule 8 isoform X2 n=1 Tax=Parus major TaxID=9157 RepID=UPI0008F53F48|nr:CMRF35-like molecule 8 isoform X2 [Parus major]
MQLLSLLAWVLLPGCGAVTGPDSVRGFLGGSLSVTCTYEPGWEESPKFWCRTIARIGILCIGRMLVTSESEPEVLHGRFSIRDNRTRREFTVTVDALAAEDAGTFLCGVRTGILRFDKSAAVKVIVVPVAAGVLLILSSKKKATSMLHPALSGAAIEMDRTHRMSPTGAEALNYADIDHNTGVAESQYSNAEAFCRLETPPMEYIEVRHSAQRLEEKREALYARVQKPVVQKEQIYTNMPSAPQPSEELYSTVYGR